MEEISKDERFAQVLWHPKFKRMSKNEKKIHIDKRFESMLSGEKFKLEYTVDKRGRPIRKTQSEDLRRYYAMSDEEENDEEEENEKNEEANDESETLRKEKDKGKEEKTFDDSSESESDDEIRIDLARGEGNILSSSDEDSNSEWEFEDDSTIEHAWGELDKDAKVTDLPKRRFAICNMEWDRVKARDLLILCRSFAPVGGKVHKVTIYPSEFGLERMKDEEINGPMELREIDSIDDDKNSDCDEESDDENPLKKAKSTDEELSAKEREKLRQYQLNRLKYFYAIVECDTAETANAIYTECDGREYERSALRLDLRFVDDEVTFDDAPPREIAQDAGDLSGYKPSIFKTTALQQASVKCTWDEGDVERKERTQNAFRSEKPEEWDDLNAYIASSSGDEVENEENDVELPDILKDKIQPSTVGNGGGAKKRINDYKSLLLQDDENKKRKDVDEDMQLEISWEPGLKSTTAKFVKEKMKEKKETEESTPFQQYLQRRKEKRRERKREIKEKRELTKMASDLPPEEQQRSQAEDEETKDLQRKKIKKNKLGAAGEEEKKTEEMDHLNLLIDDSDDKLGRKHFDMKKIIKSAAAQGKKSKKPGTDAEIAENGGDFDVDANDPRFAALYESALFSIEPSDPLFKRTKGMEKLIDEKLKRKRKPETKQQHNGPSSTKSAFLDNELNKLVESVKRQAKHGDVAKFNKKHKA